MGEINYTMSFYFKGFFNFMLEFFYSFKNFFFFSKFRMIVFCVIAGNGKQQLFLKLLNETFLGQNNLRMTVKG